MRTPVAFIIFNRPELTAGVFAAIARARPDKLFVIADGPRSGFEGDVERCAAARAITEKVDWPCDVSRNYAEVNLGCARRPASGLQWVFEQVEEAIVLEDDCVPGAGFFPYCEELLERYRTDERVMHISGNQFVTPRKPTPFSYSFSRYPLSWGWATWRRAFQHYDYRITLWPQLRQTGWLRDILGDERAVHYWTQIFDHTSASNDDITWWDFQWVFACWAQSGFSILPHVNLVSNTGFGPGASHTTNATDRLANLPAAELRLPLRHPDYVVRDVEQDALIFQGIFPPEVRPSMLGQLRGRCIAALPRDVRRSLSSIRSRFVSHSQPSRQQAVASTPTARPRG
jgi:hypothetical protein